MRPLATFLLITTLAFAAPDWVADPDNSVWLDIAATRPHGDSHGLALREDNSEGAMHPAERQGQPGIVARRPANDQPGYFYVKYTADKPLGQWLGDGHDAVLVIRYFDGGRGRLGIKYDSSDPTVHKEPYPAGVWKVPPAIDPGMPLTDSGKWRTANVPLPLALFQHRVHGADLRLEPSTPEFALGGVAVRRVPRGAEPTALVQVPVRVADSEELTAAGDHARFAGTFAQRGDDPIVMEAELAGRIGFQDGRGPGLDADASGGAYIHYVDAATFDIEVATPGRYRMWQRARFPWPGNWNHSESMNGVGAQVSDSTGEPVPGWQWVRGPVYTLPAGRNTFEISYHGGARLDLLVLSRDLETPPVLPAPSSSYVGPETGSLLTTTVRPFDVTAWRRVDLALAQPERWEIDCSRDNGATWQSLPTEGDLSKLPVTGGGQDSLRFRLRVRRGDGPPPLFAGGTIHYLAGRDNHRTVETARLDARFSPAALLSLVEQRTGRLVHQAPPMPPALARLLIKKPGAAEPRSIDLYDATFEGLDVDDNTVTLRHRFPEGIATAATLRFLDNGQIVATLAIDNRSDLEVAEIRFPVLSGIRLGGLGDDDWLHVSRCWGQVYQPPNTLGRLQTVWGTSMRWLGLWDSAAGLYLGIEDPEYRDYAFVYGPDASPGGITIAAQQRILAAPGQQWQSPVYRLAVTAGGSWHPLADIYREYVGRTLAEPQVPPYVKWLVDAWGGQQSNWMPWAGWDTISRSYDRQELHNVFLMPANRQMLDGADSGYCGLYPYPSPTWGSIREFQQQLAALRARGGFYTPYHNFHLWAPGYGHYPRIGSFAKSMLPDDVPKPDDAWYRRAVARTYGGSYIRAEEDHFAQIGMAMPSTEWRDWLAYWTARYLDWGGDGMYYDQYNMVYPNGRLYPEFDTYGAWMPATLDITRRLHDASRAANPYYTASGEVANDVYGQFLHLHMTSGVFKRIDIYSYCNPTHLLIDGGWNGGLDPDRFGGWENERFIWQVGARFEQLRGPEGALDAWAGRVLALRRAVRSILYDAAFRDTVGLEIHDRRGDPVRPDPAGPWQKEHLAPWRGTIGRWFSFRDGDQRAAVINFINEPALRGATCTLAAGFEPQFAVAWTLDGDRRELPLEHLDDERVRFPVPEAELSSVVLSAGLRPVVAWSLAPATTGGETMHLAFDITNVNDSAMHGTLKPALPAGFQATAVPFGPLAPGESMRLRLPIRVAADASPGRHDLWVNVASNFGDFRAYHVAVVNAPVLVEFRGDPGDYHLWFRNLAAAPATAQCLVTAPAPLIVAVDDGDIAIPPYAEVRVPVRVHGRDLLTAISEMTATVRLSGRAIERVRAVMPTVPNGTFETDSAGDGKPDWWMCRGLGDRWTYERLHLDVDPAGGHAVRLDPAPAGGFTRAYPVNGALEPGRRYRVSARIRGADDGVYVSCYAHLGAGQTGAEWREFSHEFTATQTGLGLSLINKSAGPAWFDDIRIEPVRPE